MRATRGKVILRLAVGLGMAAVLICACEPEPPYLPRPRRDSIPADISKVTQATDEYPPILHSDDFLTPEPVPGQVNTAGGEDSAFITPDGKTLFFFFTPDVRQPAEKQVIDGVTGLYVSQHNGTTWADGQRILLNKSDKLSLDGCYFVQGHEMWFCSVREGNYREIDMWTSTWKDGAWGDWENAGELLNVDYQVGEMHITADGQQLYYHSDMPGGVGGRDIWVIERQGDTWGPPQNVTTVNTPELDGWPFVTEDGNELWITRTYMGTPALYRSKRGPDGWQEPELILSQFAGEASLDREGNLYFTHHFFHYGEMLEADIYVARPAR